MKGEKEMEKICTAIGLVFLALFIAAILSFIIAFPIMWLWNAVMPIMFGLPKITYWLAYGFTLLVRMILPSKLNVNKGD